MERKNKKVKELILQTKEIVGLEICGYFDLPFIQQ